MPKYQTDVFTGRKSAPQPDDSFIKKVPIEVVFPAAALVANDLIELCRLAPGVQVVDFDVIAPQLDSNGAPTLAFSLGSENAGGTDLGVVYEAGLIPGRGATGSIVRATTAAALAADATAERVIALKVTTAAATSATAGKKALVVLHLKA
jgi:hypothetical protein